MISTKVCLYIESFLAKNLFERVESSKFRHSCALSIISSRNIFYNGIVKHTFYMFKILLYLVPLKYYLREQKTLKYLITPL